MSSHYKGKSSLKTFLGVMKILYYIILVMSVLFILLLFGCTFNCDYLVDLRNVFIQQHPEMTLFFVVILFAVILIPGIISIIISSLSFSDQIDINIEQVKTLDKERDNCKSSIAHCYSIINEIDNYKLNNDKELHKVSYSIYKLKANTRVNYVSLSNLNKQFYRIAKHSKLSKHQQVLSSWDAYLHSLKSIENE